MNTTTIATWDEIKRIATEHEFKFIRYNEYIALSKYTPLGEDWMYEFDEPTPDRFIEALAGYADNFDVDDEAEFWIRLRGQNGVPNSISDLLEDAQWKRAELISLSKELLGLEEQPADN